MHPYVSLRRAVGFPIVCGYREGRAHGLAGVPPRPPRSYAVPAPALFTVREAGPVAAPKPRLLDRVRQVLRSRHYSRRTEEAYVAWIRRYIFFHGKRHPAEMAAPEITRFLTSLAVVGKVAASTQNQALSAILFLYRDVLESDVPWLEGLVREKRPQRLPVVLGRDEVRAVLDRLQGTPRLMACLLYGTGLRLLECCRLRVQDVDFAAHQLGFSTSRAELGSPRSWRAHAAPSSLDLTSHQNSLSPRRSEPSSKGYDDILWKEGDAENLPFADGTFDVVVSSCGLMFAPDQQKVANEVARVTRRGGRIAIQAWTAEGGVGRMFRLTNAYTPPPPGVPSPFDWGDEAKVQRLLGPSFSEYRFERYDCPGFTDTPEQLADLFIEWFGPTHRTYHALPPERASAFRKDLTEMYRGYVTPADGKVRWGREYIITCATRA